MTSFGNALRSFRQTSNDPDRLNRRLSQERLGELIGQEMGDLGFSGAAISDWERGKSKINAADREVLLALIHVLHKNQGIRTVAEANRFLEMGNFRVLDMEETRRIFGNHPDEQSSEQSRSEADKTGAGRLVLLAALFSISREELEKLLATVNDGPPPAWPRVLAALMRKASDRFSISMTTVLWIWVWLFTWWLTGPSLRLPFDNRDLAFHAVCMYVLGSILVPLLIGLLVNTKDNAFWKEQDQVKPFLLRMYTYQGAGIGFNLGYFFVFPIALFRAFMGYDASVWLELAAAGMGLILGNMAARVVPHNLWRAYGQLTFKDGAIFFVVTLLGPLWGFIFFHYYPLFLAPPWGVLVFLVALTIAVFMMALQTKKQEP